MVTASHYEGVVKELIYSLKYSNTIDASYPLARLIAQRLGDPTRHYDLMTWVPASSRRFRQRGYNQAAKITIELAAMTGLPYRELLYRRGSTRQVGSGRSKRLQQLSGQIYVNSNQTIKGQRVLLIDDVVTTGGTLSECARVLYEDGAKTIDAAVVAKH